MFIDGGLDCEAAAEESVTAGVEGYTVVYSVFITNAVDWTPSEILIELDTGKVELLVGKDNVCAVVLGTAGLSTATGLETTLVD